MLRVSSGFEAVLKGSRSVDIRASVLDKKLNPLPTNLDIHSWTLNEDIEQVPMGIFTLTVVDPAYRIDVSPGASSKWLSRYLSFEWGVYVNDRFEYCPLFEGPITAARREGAEVTFTAATKDVQGVEPYYFKRSFSVRKHTRISAALKAIAEERGDAKLDIPSNPRRLNRDRTWAAGQEPWRVMQQLTNVLDDHQLYYRPDGYLRLRKFPESPAWKFVRDGATTILGHPENRFDIEPLFNTWMVRGERNHKKPVDVKMELDQKAEAGDNSIHVDHAPNAPNDLKPGKKIVIGGGGNPETRTIAGSYTPGSETIPLTRDLDRNHKVGAPVSVTVMKDRVKPVVGRAALTNHPYSPESLTDGKRPRIKIEDKPGIHRKDAADARAEKKIRRMRAGIETEIGIQSLIVPHLEIGDLVVVETDAGPYSFRLKNRELNSDGTMIINRRRKLVPKKPKKGNGKGPKATVKRVRKETLGGVVDEALTTSWSDGERLKVEAVTDFSAEGGSVVFEPGTDREETAHYTTIDEVTDELVGVTRPNTKKAHAAGTFVQAGEEPTIEKSIDGYVDDEMISAVGIPVPPSLYGYLSVDTVEADEKVVPLQVDEEGELSVFDGPAGEPPVFDEDLELLPAVGGGDASESTSDGHGGVRPPPGMGFEDGQVPEGTVTPVVIGGLGNTLHVRFPTLSNSSIVVYKIHCHTEEDFEPGPDTQVGTLTLAGTPDFTHSYSFKDFPAGHVLDGTPSDPPQPGTDYEVCIVPSDGSGDAEGPYPRASGTPGKVATADIISGAISADLIAAAAITSTKIEDGAISTPKLAVGAVTAAKITAGTITANEIASGAVTSDKIAANTIVAGDIASGTITATQIAGSTITADKLSVSSLSAITANLGTITAGTISSVSMASSTITSTTITASAFSTGTEGNSVSMFASSDEVRWRYKNTIAGIDQVTGSITAGFGVPLTITGLSGVKVGASGSEIGFYGVSPVSRQSMTNLSGSDSTTAQLHGKVNTLLNNLRDLGLIS